MRHHRLLPLLLPLLVLAACGEDQPTAPTPPAEPGDPAYSHTAGHKVVNSLADSGDGTCMPRCVPREAINTSGSTAITGPRTGIVIRRRSTDPDFRIFRIGPGATVTLRNLTIRDRKTDGGGGGIVNFGTLALTNSTVAGNSALHGGGIDYHGPLTLTNSTVAHNSTT